MQKLLTSIMERSQPPINKDNYISIAKAIGIILMVIGHSKCPSTLHHFIYMFHIPLFFFCSGLFHEKQKKIYSSFWKKTKGLYLPYIKWSILFLLLHNIFYRLNICNASYGYLGGTHLYNLNEMAVKAIHILFTMTEHEYLLGGFWFIKSLFLSSILLSLILYPFKKESTLINSIILFFLIILTVILRRFNITEIPIIGDPSLILFSAAFFMIGKIFKSQIKPSTYNYKYFLISLFIIILSLIHYNNLSMLCGYNKVFPYSIIATCGIYMTLYISKFINNFNIKKVFII